MEIFSLSLTTLLIITELFYTESASNCRELQESANGGLVSGTYTVQNSLLQSFTVYCQFYGGYGYTFVSTNTNVNVDLSLLYEDTSHVIIRHKRTTGQYSAVMEQYATFASTPVSAWFETSPYYSVKLRFANPVSQGTMQGWRANCQDFNFVNCDANPSSYFYLFFGPYPSGGSYTSIICSWYDTATVVSNEEHLPDEFFTMMFELHFGGCGGFSQGSHVADLQGVTVGFKFKHQPGHYVYKTVVDNHSRRHTTGYTCTEPPVPPGEKPNCAEITCPVPPDIPNGIKTYCDLHIGGVVTYACDPLYRFDSGDPVQNCTTYGNWTGETPVCIEITCPTPIDPDNGTATYSVLTIDSTVTYACNYGFLLQNGDAVHTCDLVGQWTGTVPTCAEVTCLIPDDLANGTKSYSTLNVSSSVTYSCNHGYEMLSGDAVRTCMPTGALTGMWSGVMPSCSEVTCPVPPSIGNGTFTYTGLRVDENVTYICVSGFAIVSGDVTRTCNMSGTWSGTELICAEVLCPIPSSIVNGTMNYTGVNVNDSVTYSCDGPHVILTGDVTRTCDVSGTWTGTEPVCGDPMPTTTGPPSTAMLGRIYIAPCLCYPNKTFTNLTEDEILAYLTSRGKIDPRNTSHFLDARRCRWDPRMSSAVLATFACVLLAVFAAVLLCFDAASICLNCKTENHKPKKLKPSVSTKALTNHESNNIVGADRKEDTKIAIRDGSDW